MNKKLISGISILVILALTLSIWLYTERQTLEPLVPSPSPEQPEPFVPPPSTEQPEPRPLSTGGYVYDDKLNFGFVYPDGWEFFINVDKDVEQCDPLHDYVNSNINCVDFPDKNIRKVVSFEKNFLKKVEGSDYESEVSVQLDLIVKSAPDLQEVENEFQQGLPGVPVLNEATISEIISTGMIYLSE